MNATDAQAQTNDRTRWLALYVLCAGMLMIVLDATIVNVALPTIQDSLGFSQNNLAWVINAYMIPFGGLLLLAGRLGDLLGQRRVFLFGLAIFTVASLVCAASQTQEMLVGARFVQGFGGALASAVILGMIVTMFPEPGAQAKAIGVYGFVASAGGSIGLLLGGVLTEAISWHWIFLINLPIGIATAYLARRLVANPEGIGLKEGADFPGAALITVSLMLGVFTILQITDWGWLDTRTIVLSAVSAALLAIFIRRQATIANPLMPLRLFRSRNVAGSNVLQSLLVAGMFGMFFLGALYLQRVLGYSALQVGLAFLPTTLVMGTLSLGFSEKLIMRFGPRTTLIPGVCLVVVALLLFATRTPVDGNYLTDLLPPLLLIGIGVGTSFPAIMTLAMSGATPSDAGLASGLVNTSMQVGGAIGLAVLATLSTERTQSLIGAGTSHAQALASGYHVAYFVGAGLAAIAVAIAVLVLRSPRPQLAVAAAQEGEREPAYSEVG
ncbi:MAG TPA: DHA2 family efflux MFS transporter permease subunit [Solirubrobacterales bacterium]|jgi:EmrB/QacA subfamily drug resistance transporter|nr:DHA2 family efflux MFS transporter permease subunit [Solirubrobacterales bacterium]